MNAPKSMLPVPTEDSLYRVQVEFLPQRSVIAPGSSLAQQLAYGTSSCASPATMRGVLQSVNLPHLLHRVSGDLHQEADWAGGLLHSSPVSDAADVFALPRRAVFAVAITPHVQSTLRLEHFWQLINIWMSSNATERR